MSADLKQGDILYCIKAEKLFVNCQSYEIKTITPTEIVFTNGIHIPKSLVSIAFSLALFNESDNKKTTGIATGCIDINGNSIMLGSKLVHISNPDLSYEVRVGDNEFILCSSEGSMSLDPNYTRTLLRIIK